MFCAPVVLCVDFKTIFLLLPQEELNMGILFCAHTSFSGPYTFDIITTFLLILRVDVDMGGNKLT